MIMTTTKMIDKRKIKTVGGLGVLTGAMTILGVHCSK